MNIIDMLKSLWKSTGVAQGSWQNYVMILISFVLFYLAIARKFEPLLLLPIAFGMLMVNIPGAVDVLFFEGYSAENHVLPSGTSGGLFYYLYQGVDKVIYPPLIFLGIGAMTDFGPLIANPKSLLIGAGAQLGIFVTFFGAILLFFNGAEAASIAIIGGADGPTAIYLNQQLSKLYPEMNVGNLLPAIAIAAYSYMALIPAIQPPIMRALTTPKERSIRMGQLRVVSKREKIIFPIVVVALVALILPQALPLVGCLMFGNLLKESTVTERLAKTASNELINIITIVLGLMVGSKAIGPTFLKPQTLAIIALGLVAFCVGTIGGILVAKVMNKLSGGKINPLIGSAGVSAVPMAARVSQKEGQRYDPDNYLLMHAMGPNVAGVIGSAVAAGFLLAVPW
ncbi:MAG: sodium ion-translocating decarboxylase subunit beta [Clostridiales bacterium]|nr:sodium ion-translocating decarboxylase subunit beta [Clostridiales bacterium]